MRNGPEIERFRQEQNAAAMELARSHAFWHTVNSFVNSSFRRAHNVEATASRMRREKHGKGKWGSHAPPGVVSAVVARNISATDMAAIAARLGLEVSEPAKDIGKGHGHSYPTGPPT